MQVMPSVRKREIDEVLYAARSVLVDLLIDRAGDRPATTEDRDMLKDVMRRLRAWQISHGLADPLMMILWCITLVSSSLTVVISYITESDEDRSMLTGLAYGLVILSTMVVFVIVALRTLSMKRIDALIARMKDLIRRIESVDAA